MEIQDQAMKALDLLESSEVMKEFDDSLWIKIDRDLWEEFIGYANNRDLLKADPNQEEE